MQKDPCVGQAVVPAPLESFSLLNTFLKKSPFFFVFFVFFGSLLPAWKL